VHLEFYDDADVTILEIQAPVDVVIFHGQILVNKFLFNETLLISKAFQYFCEIVEQRFKFNTNRFLLFYTMFSRTATGVQNCIVSFLVLQSF